MAHSVGPLLSSAASGSVGPLLTFSQRRTGQLVRYQRKQADVVTADRSAQRSLFQEAVTFWASLSAGEKAAYNAAAAGLLLSGYSLFIKLYLLGEISSGLLSFYGSRIYGVFLYGSES